MATLSRNDIRLLTFLYKDCRSYKYYPHLVIAIEDMGPCGLSIKEIFSSMDYLRTIYAYHPGYEEYDPLIKDYLTWSFTEEQCRKDKELSRLFFDLKLDVEIAQNLLLHFTSSQAKPQSSTPTENISTT